MDYPRLGGHAAASEGLPRVRNRSRSLITARVIFVVVPWVLVQPRFKRPSLLLPTAWALVCVLCIILRRVVYFRAVSLSCEEWSFHVFVPCLHRLVSCNRAYEDLLCFVFIQCCTPATLRTRLSTPARWIYVAQSSPMLYRE